MPDAVAHELCHQELDRVERFTWYRKPSEGSPHIPKLGRRYPDLEVEVDLAPRGLYGRHRRGFPEALYLETRWPLTYPPETLAGCIRPASAFYPAGPSSRPKDTIASG